jgi:predicted DCC family thiol-disulfide oxidoreductase YuxK
MADPSGGSGGSGGSGEAVEHGRSILVYDADCSFCRWSLQRILDWDRRGCLRALALQAPEADRLLADIPPQRRMDSWHLVAPGGQVSSAGRAVGPLLRLLPGGAPFARLADALPRLTDAAYALVARRRSWLGRIVVRGRRG